MSDSSRHALSAIAEVTYGVTPTTPNFKKLRHTGATLALTKSSNTSGELRPDRQIAEFRHGTKQVGGELAFELSFDSFHDQLEAALCGTWAPKALLEDKTTMAADGVAGLLSDSANGFLAAGFEINDIVTVSGFTTPANNGTFKVSNVQAGTLTLRTIGGAPAGLVTEAPGDVITVETTSTILKAGVARRSFSVLRHFTDIDSAGKPFHLYAGVIINTLSLSLTPDAMVTGSFGTVGQKLALSTAAPAGTTYTEAPSTRVFDAFTGSLVEGGVTLALITEISLTLENGVAPRFVAFSDETILPQIGQSNLTGSVSLYFENATMYEKFINETISSLEFTLTDLDGNSYKFTLPRISYTGGQPDVSGAGSITLTMPLQAIYDAETATNISIIRIPAAE